MKTFFKIIAGIVAIVLVLAISGFVWASSKTKATLARTIDVHTVDFPIPYPLADSEVVALKISADSAGRLALVRATERGRHLVESRYPCMECHSPNFGGGTMVDAPVLGRLLGPNLTLGEGSRTLTYRATDWDRIVRHGVRPDGTPAGMPSQDFERMSDQELSDIVTYIRTHAPVDSTVPPVKFGPLGKVLIATGKLPVSADLIKSHTSVHATYPPPSGGTLEFGAHLAATCSGCHGPSFAGGPIKGGDPAWPPAKNLTPHPDALGTWTFEQFKAALRTGKRPDGTELKAPMSAILPYANKMRDVEFEALWMYLQSLAPIAPAT